MIGQQLSNKNEELSKQASNPNVDIKDIEQLKSCLLYTSDAADE